MAWLKDSAADFFVADFFAPAAALVLAAGLAGDFDFVFLAARALLLGFGIYGSQYASATDC